MENSFIIILVTTSSKEEANKIIHNLLDKKLIACANIVGPVASYFQWEGKIEQAEEYLVLMKSRLDLFDALSGQVKALHSYKVPEILVLPITAGSKTYLDWLNSSLKQSLDVHLCTNKP